MPTTQADVVALRTRNAAVVTLAKRALAQFWSTLDLSDPYRARDALLEFVPQLVASYGQVAATVAADWYETVRAKDVAGSFAAVLADVAPAEQVQANVRFQATPLFGDNPGYMLQTLAGAVQMHVVNASRETIRSNVGRDPARPRYARVPTGSKTCAWCSLLASRGFVYASETTAGRGNKYHHDCVVGETLVSGPKADAAYGRYFEGEIVTLVTAAGHQLTITPNHPVLTDRGWVRAGLLNEGDQLVSAVSADGHVVSGPDEDHVPARIEDLVRSLSVVSSASRLSVPGAAEQFHGDGFNSEVDVVTRDDLFRGELDAPFVQPMAELPFQHGTAECPVPGLLSTGGGEFSSLLDAAGAPPGRSIGRRGLGSPFVGSHPRGSDEGSFLAAARREPRFGEPPVDSSAGNRVTGGHRESAVSSRVPFGKVGRRWDRGVGGWVGGSGPSFDPPEFQRPVDTSAAYTKLGGDLLHRLAGQVHLDRLISKSVGQFAGHVYNLSTREGWYNANGITVSNCDCQAVADWSDDPRIEGYDPSKLYDVYQSARAATPGRTDAAIAAEMRRQFPDMFTDGVATRET